MDLKLSRDPAQWVAFGIRVAIGAGAILYNSDSPIFVGVGALIVLLPLLINIVSTSRQKLADIASADGGDG